MLKAQVQDILPTQYEAFPLADLTGSIVDRFQKIASRYPNNVAAEDVRGQYTYEELVLRANHVANIILDRSEPCIGPIALLYSRAAGDLFIAQLAVIKSGSFFAVLDCNSSEQKLQSIVADLQPRMLLCNDQSVNLATALANRLARCQVVNTATRQALSRIGDPNVARRSSDIAYITYTSGSTGEPRGVAVSDRGVLHYVMTHINNIHLRSDDRSAQICAVDSAVSAGEAFQTLLSGGTLLPYSVRDEGFSGLARWMRQKRVTVLTAVPTAFRLLVDAVDDVGQLSSVRLIRLSGDRVLASDVELYQRHFSDTCLLRVSLAATECLSVTQFWVSKGYRPERAVIPVGYALEDKEVFVVDDEMNCLAPLERGEIAVKSKYLAIGYWNNPTLTAERFLDPEGEEGERIYLTQDYGYLEEDGCLVHTGRKDFRVKVYGRMVSLVDVEEVMLGVAGIKEAVVVPAGGGIERRLVAFFVADATATVDQASLTTRLLRVLPPEFVPKRYIRLDAMPVTKNNKIDRRRLEDSCIGLDEGR